MRFPPFCLLITFGLVTRSLTSFIYYNPAAALFLLALEYLVFLDSFVVLKFLVAYIIINPILSSCTLQKYSKPVKMRFSLLIASVFAAAAVAQNCGPSYGNQKCAAGKCCSQYGWVRPTSPSPSIKDRSANMVLNRQCDVGAAYCDPATCLKTYSGTGSSCAGATNPYASTVPSIDVCGRSEGGVTCPGAGAQGYYYRCCSSAGHCGPKNPVSPYHPNSASGRLHPITFR